MCSSFTVSIIFLLLLQNLPLDLTHLIFSPYSVLHQLRLSPVLLLLLSDTSTEDKKTVRIHSKWLILPPSTQPPHKKKKICQQFAHKCPPEVKCPRWSSCSLKGSVNASQRVWFHYDARCGCMILWWWRRGGTERGGEMMGNHIGAFLLVENRRSGMKLHKSEADHELARESGVASDQNTQSTHFRGERVRCRSGGEIKDGCILHPSEARDIVSHWWSRVKEITSFCSGSRSICRFSTQGPNQIWPQWLTRSGSNDVICLQLLLFQKLAVVRATKMDRSEDWLAEEVWKYVHLPKSSRQTLNTVKWTKTPGDWTNIVHGGVQLLKCGALSMTEDAGTECAVGRSRCRRCTPVYSGWACMWSTGKQAATWPVVHKLRSAAERIREEGQRLDAAPIFPNNPVKQGYFLFSRN